MENVGCVEIAIYEKILYGNFFFFNCSIHFQQLLFFIIIIHDYHFFIYFHYNTLFK